MPSALKILLVEDNPADAELVLRELRRGGFEPQWRRVDTEGTYLEQLHAGLDLVISDYAMPQFSGVRALDLLKQRRLDVPFIIVSGTIGEDTAVATMRHGAADYLMKDRLGRLGTAVTHALEEARSRRERLAALEALASAEARYRGLFENSVEGIYQTTPDGRLLIANATLVRLAGYTSADEMIASVTNVGEQFYVNPEDRARFMKVMGSEGLVRNFETQMRRRDGSLCWVSSNAWRIRDAAGNICFEGAMMDITERRQADQKIREQLTELLRWQEVMLGREDRVIALKAEVNELLTRLGETPRYASPRPIP